MFVDLAGSERLSQHAHLTEEEYIQKFYSYQNEANDYKHT